MSLTMKFLLPLALAGVGLLAGCQSPRQQTTAATKPLTTIAFGSCSDQKRPKPLWDDVVAAKPDLWIWLGDNIYGDSQNMDTLRAKYNRQKSEPGYQALRQSTPIIGVWDDHDYGVNDGGKEYPKRVESQQLMLDFLDVPANDPLRKQTGGYSVHTYGPKGKQVKVILLDGRYFRDPLKKDSGGKNNVPDPSGDILGEAQWTWLEQQLTNSTADVHIIGCGIQFISDDHPYEKWGNFPTAQKRLWDLLGKTKPKGAMLISGDRHIGEISKTQIPGLGYDLYDITSSGLTHTWAAPRDEPNKHRVKDMVVKLNFGLITIDWSKKPLTASVSIMGDNRANFLTHEIVF